MTMELEQELRDILQRDSAELVPVGPGPEEARRRAFRRKRRVQSGVVMISAAGLVGGTIAVIETRDPGHGPGPRVQTQPIAPTSDLVWRSVDGTVLVTGAEFTTPAGITYALSTAPGSKPSIDNGTAPQELYATRDGVTWTHESLGAKPWIVDLTESKGVLYAVGTGPGAQTGSFDYNLATSTDNGARWSVDRIPVDFTPPKSTVPLTESRSVHLARGAHTTVAMAKVSYWPDVSKVIGDAPYTATAAGVQILGKADCLKMTAPTVAPVRGSAPEGCKQAVESTRPWTDFGISDPAALHQQQALVRDDGGDWTKADVPAASDSWVQDVSATTNGFLMVEQVPGTDRVGDVQLWSSTDGRAWAPLSGAVPKFDNVSIAGDRVIGGDASSSNIYVSNDAGATWIVTGNVGGLLPSGTALEPNTMTVDAGPLGYAVLVRSGGEGRTEHSYLLHSSDGATWKVTDLAAAGAPANGQISSVSVGADHIDVSYEVPQGQAPDGAAATYKLVELLGTPKAS
jgi:hypothetical protein